MQQLHHLIKVENDLQWCFCLLWHKKGENRGLKVASVVDCGLLENHLVVSGC
jgi:hypothetical protein